LGHVYVQDQFYARLGNHSQLAHTRHINFPLRDKVGVFTYHFTMQADFGAAA